MSSKTNLESFSEPSAFVEVQWSPVWALALVGFAALLALAACVMAFWRERNIVLLLPPVLVLLTFNVLRVRTRVNAHFLTVTFGALFPLYRKRVRLAEITSAQAVVYDPLGEYSGWGIRGTSGDQCLNARKRGRPTKIHERRQTAGRVAKGGRIGSRPSSNRLCSPVLTRGFARDMFF